MKKKKHKQRKKHKSNSILQWGRAFLLALLILWVFKSGFFDLYLVSSRSMNATIQKGDFIIGNKLAVGPRLPITPLSIPFTHQEWLGFQPYSKIVQLPYWRIPGYDTVSRGDIIIFNYPNESHHPIDQRTFFIKRCVALSGDELTIKDKKLFVNREKTEFKGAELQFEYSIEIDRDLFEQIEGHSTINFPKKFDGKFSVNITKEQAEKLKSRKGVKSVRKTGSDRYQNTGLTFPSSPNLKWTKDNFGPLKIPGEGWRLKLNKTNFELYSSTIRDHENHDIERIDDQFYIDGKETEYYTFEQNYYFILGDNRDNSSDSRYWGFLPESHVVAITSRILFSVNDEGVNWQRTLKSLTE